MNTLFVQRLLQGIQRPTPGLLPLNTAEEETPRQSRASKGGSKTVKPRGGMRERDRGGSEYERSRGGSEYERSRGGARVEKSRGRRSPSSSSEETEKYGSPSSSDYDSYDDPEVIKQRYRKEPCEYVSPGTLGTKKTKKDVVKYLEEKKCPKIETHAKKRKHVPATVSSAPASTPAPPPPAPVDNSPPPPAPSQPPPPPVKDEIAKRPIGRPKKPAADPAKPKKAPSAYATAVGKYRRQGLPFTEAVARAKEELASK
jgi:hypothetical protein